MTKDEFKLDLETLQTLKRQLVSNEVMPRDGAYTYPVHVCMTVDGVVLIGAGMMHPETFRDVFGEEEYQDLLKQPRVANPYGDEDD